MDHVTSPGLWESVDHARTREIVAIRAATKDNKIVGITGPSEVGKTKLLRSILAPLGSAEPARAIVQVDLDAVYSPRHLMRRWLRAIAQGAAGPIAFSHIAAGAEARAMWPSSTRQADHLVRDLLQDDYTVALQGDREARPSKGGEEHIARALAATARLADKRPTTLIIDHLESPELSGALDVRNLLWQVRALSQRSPLRVVIACRPSAVDLAADANAAFYGDGAWLTIEPPNLETWREIASGTPGIERICELTGGHIWSTVLVLARMGSFKLPDEAFDNAALEHQPLAARCVQHASTLHRLAPQVVIGIANGLGPYQAIPDAQSRDIAEAALRLDLAGLAWRPHPRTWQIVNPLVSRVLRSVDQAHLPSARTRLGRDQQPA